MSNSSSSGSFLGLVERKLMPLEDLANLFAAFAILLLMLLGVAQIGLRTIFNAPISGYIDMVELSMASMAFMGAAYTQRLGAHIRMELLIGKVQGRKLWAMEIFGTLVALGIIGILVWFSAHHFWRAYTLGDTTMDAELPVWPSKLLVPIAFTLWFMRLFIQLMGSVRLFIRPSALPVGVVIVKDVAEQAQDEIHEVLGADASQQGGEPK